MQEGESKSLLFPVQYDLNCESTFVFLENKFPLLKHKSTRAEFVELISGRGYFRNFRWGGGGCAALALNVATCTILE